MHLRLVLPHAEEPEACPTVFLTIPAGSHDNYFLIAQNNLSDLCKS